MNKEYITTLMILWVLLDFENLILGFSIFGCCMGMKKVMEMGFNIHCV
jgi:hypothetical protein